MFLLLKKKVLSEHWKCHFEYHYPLVRFILDTIACFYDIVFNTIAKLFSSYRCMYKFIIVIIISLFPIRNN